MKGEGVCLSSAHRFGEARQRQAKLGPVRIGARKRKLPAERDCLFPSNTQNKTLDWHALFTALSVKSFEDLVGALLWNRFALVCHSQLDLPIACLRHQANAA